MEEILASIRRIISEEDDPGAAPAPVLELSQPAPAEAAVFEDDIVFDSEPENDFVVEDAPPPIAPQPAPPMVQAAAPVYAQAPAPPADPIISSPAASAAAGSLQRLAGGLRIADTHNQTVEGVVRELLKPMLKEWLDHNLPAIVEARVEAELERISRLAR